MSYRLIQRLEGVENEYRVCLTSVSDTERKWPQLASEPEWRSFRMTDVQQTLTRLEGTYIIRLFSEYEGCLQDHLTASGLTHLPQTAQALINRVASREHIAPPLVVAAHQVRIYRNGLVHPLAVGVIAYSFSDARRALNQYLAWLPDLP